MANIKVSEMTQADSINDIDLLMIVQGNVNKKVTKQKLMESVNSAISSLQTNISNLQNSKQDKLTAGSHITIQNNTISATYTNATTSNSGLMSASDKSKLNGIEAEATKTIVDSTLSSTSTNPVQNKIIYESQEEQNNLIQELQEENEKLKKALPQIKGTGTDITLNNTSDNKFNDLVIGGNTEQNTLTGKNKADITKIPNKTGSYTLIVANDTITLKDNTNNSGYSNPSKTLSEICPNIQVGDSVTLSFKTTSSLQNKNNIYLAGANILWANETSKTITQEMLDSTVAFYGGYNETAVISEFMIRLSSVTDASYEPYCGGIPSPNPDYPQQIKNVTGNANVKVQNKNLFDIDNLDFVNGYYDNQGNFIANNNNGIFDYIKVKPNTSYAFSFSSNVYNISIVEFDSSKKYIQRNNVSSVNKEIITTSNTTSYIRIGTNLTNSPTVTKQAVKSLNPQLEENTTATSYVPHQEQNLPLTLGNIELCKIDTAKDKFIKQNGKWYKHEEIGKGIITTVNSVGVASSGIKYALVGLINNILNNSFIYCSNYINSNSANMNNSIRVINSSLYVYDNRFTDLQTANSLLNGLEYYYILATPTDTEITDITLKSQLEAILEAMSYYEQTNISSTSDETSAIIEANAVGDLNLILN